MFSSILAKNGVMIRPAGLEAPEQIGRVERRGDMLKKMMSKVIKDSHVSGRESIDMILSECMNAANQMTRDGGFAPVLQEFLVVKEEHNPFRLCGKEIQQDEDFGIRVTAKDNTERVQSITHEAKHGLTQKATASQVHQLRSVTQSLAWIARQTRPDLAYCILKIQSTFENACVRYLRKCNRIVEYAILHPRVAFFFS